MAAIGGYLTLLHNGAIAAIVAATGVIILIIMGCVIISHLMDAHKMLVHMRWNLPDVIQCPHCGSRITTKAADHE